MHVQNSVCKSRQVDWTYRVLSARLSVLRARAENLVHGLPLGVTVQRLPCTSRQVCWTYRVYFARSGMLWCPPRKCSPLVRGRRVSCIEIICWIQGRFLFTKRSTNTCRMFATSRSQCGRSLSKFRRAETLNKVGPSRGP